MLRKNLRSPYFTVLAGLILFASVARPSAALALDNRWGFGTDLGFVSGTVNGTVFALNFSLDYYVDRNFSFGPMALLSPMGDLTQIGLAGVGRYHVRFNNGINLVPFAGIGLIHADLDRGTGSARIDRNDTSWYIPIGLSLEYQVVHNIAISSTLMVNLHDIDLSPSLQQNDTTSVALLFGFRWGP